jgi:dTDP-4-amino-4,6-dideoxygalactose transaminase
MTTPIAMADPVAEYRLLKVAIDGAVAAVLGSGRFVLGPEGEALERALAAYVGTPHAVGVNSGTDALHLALVAAGIGPGDEVIVPGFTFIATAEAVSHSGATPVFADIDPQTFNLDPRSLREVTTPRTRAVIVVHLFGQCSALDDIAAICDETGLLLIEDCAQALGADYDGRRAGSWGAFGAFSFYPTKNLAAAGDAGLVTTREESHDRALRMLRHHGSAQTYRHERIGWNSRLDELQAAVLRVKLSHLDAFNERRRDNARAYRERLADVAIELPYEHGRGQHVYHQFTIQSERRDALRQALTDDGIASGVFYPMPLHRQPAYETARPLRPLPACERSAERVLSIPIHPFLAESDIDRICGVIRASS